MAVVSPPPVSAYFSDFLVITGMFPAVHRESGATTAHLGAGQVVLTRMLELSLPGAKRHSTEIVMLHVWSDFWTATDGQ